ncbi:anti-sigma factor domain-containing protein [Paenibacillus chungangensis]|uniref:Anti-sigma factor domain-containing protein n=1 Tax=Paenibacillus chungangensis TaxID=696535 RepID=A0ABW3HV70_9BACL
MKRGVVMSINKKYSTVMTADGQFVRVPLQGSPQIGEEILFEEAFRRPGSFRTLYRYAAAAAVTGVLLTACLLYALSQVNPVVAYLTIDINPSLEMGVDKNANVLTLRALNEEGERLVAGFHYKGMDIDTAASVMLQRAADEHYLDEPHRDILITNVLMRERSGVDELESKVADGLRERLNDMLKRQLPDKEVTITTLSAPKELRDEADANGISTGKMAVYLMAKDEGYQLEMNEVKAQTIDKVTEPMGGLQQVVAEEERASNAKEKLRQLLIKEREQEEKDKASHQSTIAPSKNQDKPQIPQKPTSTKKPTLKPAVTPTKVPVGKPTKKPKEESGKPSSRPVAIPDGKGNGKWQNDDDDDDRKQGNYEWRDKDENRDNDRDDDDDRYDEDRDDDRGDRDDDDHDNDDRREDRDDRDDRDDEDRDDDRGNRRDDWNQRNDRNDRKDREKDDRDDRDSWKDRGKQADLLKNGDKRNDDDDDQDDLHDDDGFEEVEDGDDRRGWHNDDDDDDDDNDE